MKTPDCVIWALTKRNSSYLVKFNGNEFTHDPHSVTGFHNASESANKVSIHGARVATKKGAKRVFTLTQEHHNARHGLKKAKPGKSLSRLNHAEQPLTKETTHAVKVINGLDKVNQTRKNRIVRRLARLHAANRTHVEAAPKK